MFRAQLGLRRRKDAQMGFKQVYARRENHRNFYEERRGSGMYCPEAKLNIMQMSIGRNFEEAIQKSIRMVHGGKVNGFESGRGIEATDDGLVNASYQRILVIAEAMSKGDSVERIHELTKIDNWFLYKLKKISNLENDLRSLKTADALTPEKMLEAKKLGMVFLICFLILTGFSDNQIARCLHTTELVIRTLRQQNNIIPVVKQIDTVAAEFPATNNYLYLTYNGIEDDIPRKSADLNESIIVLGSGAYSIGSSVEFGRLIHLSEALTAIRLVCCLLYSNTWTARLQADRHQLQS